jgi:hypothetical protein
VNPLNILAAILLWAAQADPSGSISGIIRSQTGALAANVRVLAIPVTKPDAFENITQTDNAGRYRLENLAPGRYYIAAGSAAVRTFHPGTSTQTAATIVTVTRDSTRVSRMDFELGTLSSPGRVAPANPNLACCNLNFVTEDRRLLPLFPSALIVKNIRNNTIPPLNLIRGPNRGPALLRIPINSTAELSVQGLPPGYVLKSVAYGGKDHGLNPFLVDGNFADIDLILGYDLTATSKKVTVRGKVVSIAPEAKMKTIRFTSTIPNGPTLEAPLQPDGSFEFPEIPVGAYQTGGHNDARMGMPMGVYTNIVLLDNVSGLTLNMHANPFPEFVDAIPERMSFPGGKSAEITGVITFPLRKIGTGDAAYFLMNVKDAATGAVTPWAVFAEHADETPQILQGATITVPGVVANDGTNRMIAYPF